MMNCKGHAHTDDRDLYIAIELTVGAHCQTLRPNCSKQRSPGFLQLVLKAGYSAFVGICPAARLPGGSGRLRQPPLGVLQLAHQRLHLLLRGARAECAVQVFQNEHVHRHEQGQVPIASGL